MSFLRHLSLRGATRTPRRKRVCRDFLRAFTSEATIIPPASNDSDRILQYAQKPHTKINDLIQAYLNRNTLFHTTAEFGSRVEPYYRPNDLIVRPPSAVEVNEELLLAAQTHLGHATSIWHPANSRYIFGVREGIHIISLDITAAHLKRAARVVSGVTERGGIVLFVGTRRGHERLVVRAAELAGGCHVFEHWVPGTITNGQQILGRSYTKVVDELDRDVEGFEKQLGDLPPLKPDLVVCFNLLENYILLHECGLLGIPTVGVVDTDVNPTWVTYPIPANDDSIRSVATIAGVLGRAGQDGQNSRRLAALDGRATYLPPQGLQLPEGEQDETFGEEDLGSNDENAEARQRAGRGTNFYEAGVTPSGSEALDPILQPMLSESRTAEKRA